MLQRHFDSVVTRVSDLFSRHHKINRWWLPNVWTDSYFVAGETIAVLDHAYVIGLILDQIELILARLVYSP
jgi:hypothetical protein